MSGHILVVDDEVTLVDLLVRFLEHQGYKVSTAFNGREALEKVQQAPPDLILLDVMMPELNGFAVCKHLKNDEQTALIPIIVLTGQDDYEYRRRVIEMGADDLLAKPYEQAILRALITSHLKRKRRTDAILEAERKAIEQLAAIANDSFTSPDSVTMTFNFPAEVKTACEQYLLYFVEFLKDIGIDATASLRNNAGHVLFAVTPKDKDEALENIWEALQVYLRLPASRSVATVASPETSMGVQKLGAQVYHLQSQIMFANATIQQQQFTISQQGDIIHHQQTLIQQQLLSGKVLLESLQEMKSEEDTEPIAGDIVKAKKWTMEGVPVEVDLPEIIRWLKEKFKRKRLD